MEQYNDSSDTESRHTKHLDIYHADLLLENKLPIDALIALERLIQVELSLTQDESERLGMVLDGAGVLPTLEQIEDSPHEVIELFALAPLRFLSSYVDMNFTEEEAERWYKKAIQIALSLAPRHTSEECFVAKRQTSACEKSSLCPYKEAYRLLVKPARDYDFTSPSYIIGGDQHVANIEMKLDIASQCGLIEVHTAAADAVERDRKHELFKRRLDDAQ